MLWITLSFSSSSVACSMFSLTPRLLRVEIKAVTSSSPEKNAQQILGTLLEWTGHVAGSAQQVQGLLSTGSIFNFLFGVPLVGVLTGVLVGVFEGVDWHFIGVVTRFSLLPSWKRRLMYNSGSSPFSRPKFKTGVPLKISVIVYLAGRHNNNNFVNYYKLWQTI